MSESVRVPSVQLLMKELNCVTQWDMMGVFLGLETSDIKDIEATYPLAPGRRKVEMFTLWMKKERYPSWEKVIEALKEISELSLAAHLQEKYIQHQDQPRPTLHSSIASMCGRGSVDTTTDPGKVIKLNRKKDGIARKFEEIELEFAQLVIKTQSALESEQTPLAELKRLSMYYLTAHDLTTVSSMEELFDKLEPYYCFLSYTLLELTVRTFLQHTPLTVRLTDYDEHLEEFKSSTTVLQFMENIERTQSTPSEDAGMCTVTIRLVNGWLPKTIESFEKLVKEIFDEKSSVLSHLRIRAGSVVVSYHAPSSETANLVSMAREKLSFMSQIGISGLQIGGTVLFDEHSNLSAFSFEMALIRAVERHDLKFASFFLDLDTSPDTTDDDEWTALMISCFAGREDVVNLLLNANADTNIQRGDGLTALYIASQEGHSEVVSLLLKANANPNLRDDNGITALLIATEHGHSDVVCQLLKVSAALDPQTDDDLAAALLLASQKGHVEVVSMLLPFIATPDHQTDSGDTALFAASQNGHSDVVSLLLNAGADPDVQCENDVTALYIASTNGHTEVVRLLLEVKCSLCTDSGYTPLSAASQNGHSEIVLLLLVAIVEQYQDDGETYVNQQDENGSTALMLAHPHPDIVQLLLRHGANPNIQDDEHWTALMFACQDGYLETVEVLLVSSADPNLQNDLGETACILANYHGYHDIVQLLITGRMDSNSALAKLRTNLSKQLT